MCCIFFAELDPHPQRLPKTGRGLRGLTWPPTQRLGSWVVVKAIEQLRLRRIETRLLSATGMEMNVFLSVSYRQSGRKCPAGA